MVIAGCVNLPCQIIGYPITHVILDLNFEKICKITGFIMFRRIIWLGDLNYRINLSYEKTRELISKKEWSKLLENDQVRSFSSTVAYMDIIQVIKFSSVTLILN